MRDEKSEFDKFFNSDEPPDWTNVSPEQVIALMYEELRGPIGTVRGCTELLLAALSEKDDESMHRFLEIMQKYGYQLDHVMKTLRAYAIDYYEQNLERKEADNGGET